MNTEGLLHDVRKKDDDMRVLHDARTGDVYVETIVDLDSAAAAAESSSPSLFEAAAAGVNVDVHVLVVQHMFFVYSLGLTSTLLIATPFYMWHRPSTTTLIVCLCVAAGGIFPLAYGLLLWGAHHKKHRYELAAALGGCWAACVLIVICASLLAQKAAAFQLVTLLNVQCIMMLVYTKMSPRVMHVPQAIVFMTLATLAQWGVSIALFYYDRDWMLAIVMLCVALACVPYHGYQVRAAEGRYGVSADDLMASVVHIFTDPVLGVISALTT